MGGLNVLLLVTMLLVDSRRLRDRSRRLDVTLDVVHTDDAALLVDLERRLIATLVGSATVLAVFGVWATLSGLAQVVVALRRRGPRTGGQWPMLIAGGLSTLVGIFYGITAATSAAPTFDPLVAYAAAGGAFFVAQAALLAWYARRGAASGRGDSACQRSAGPES